MSRFSLALLVNVRVKVCVVTPTRCHVYKSTNTETNCGVVDTVYELRRMKLRSGDTLEVENVLVLKWCCSTLAS